MNPTLDLSKIYRIFYNVQTVSVLNPDGGSWTNVEALREPTDTVMVDDNGNGTYSQRTACTWVFFKTTVPNDLIPQLNTRITDSNGTDWYVSDVQNRYYGNVFTLKTESRAGVGVENQQVPVPTTSTSSTTVTPATSTTCAPSGFTNNGLQITSSHNFCARTRPNGWTADNTAFGPNGTAYVEFEVVGALGAIDIFVDAGGVSNGSAILYRNGSVYEANFSGSTRTVNFVNPSVGDVWQLILTTANPLFAAVAYIDIDGVGATTSTTTTSTT